MASSGPRREPDDDRKPILRAIRLRRQFDRRVGVELGRSSATQQLLKLVKFISPLLKSKEVPYPLKRNMLVSLMQHSNDFIDGIAARDIPDIEKFILGLRTLDIPAESEHRRFMQLRETVEKQSRESRRLEAELMNDPDFLRKKKTQGVFDDSNNLTQALVDQLNELWTDLGTITQTQLFDAMADFQPPSSRELVEAFNGEP